MYTTCLIFFFSLLAVSNVNNPVGLVCLPYVMWSAHFFVNTHRDGKDKLLERPDRSCLLLYVSARASTKTFVSRIHIR